jgi:hypothetical protein
MPLMCLLRSVAAGLLALLLVTGAGCSKTTQKPEAAQPQAAAPPAFLPQASTLPTSSAEPPKTLFPSSPSPHAGEGPGVKAAGFESDSKPPAVAPQAAAPQPPREMTAPPSFSRSKRAVAPELPTLSQLPAAEFQHLPAAPPSDPLPKPAPETIGRLDASSAPEPSAAGNARPGEMQNPLRGAEQAPVRPAPPVGSAAAEPAAPAEPSPASPLAAPTPSPAPPLSSSASAPPAPFPPSTTPPAPLPSPSAPPSAPQTIGAAAEPSPATAQPLAGRPKTQKNSGIPFEPIKVNGPIFEGWTKPKLALVITGMEDGYLEPCGCSGYDRMKGGMARRASFFQKLRHDYGWPVVGLDVGGLIHGFGGQASLKFQTLVESKRKMGYEAITFGADDLRLPAGELAAVAVNEPVIFVDANVGLLGKPGEIPPATRVIEAGGMKIGVTAILGKSYLKELHNDEIQTVDPDAALAKVIPELKQKTDYVVLLAHATQKEAEALGQKFPDLNVVVSSEGWEEPPARPSTIPGTKIPLVTVGHKGMYAAVLGLYGGPRLTVRYQRVTLDSRFDGSRDMKLLMTAYQEQLKNTGFAGLGLRPTPSPQFATNGRFVGPQKCESCHEKSYEIWKKSGHAHAYNTLAKLDPPRNFDPECVSCHIVGWNPGKFFPYESGYQSQEKTPHLVNVGCEDCHGPGEKHVAAELSGSEALRQQLRKAMVLTKADAKKTQCISCHDSDNSIEFKFDLYWPFVEHYEKDQ